MSRQRNNYGDACFGRFERWINGEIDPLEGWMGIAPPPPSSLTDEMVTVDYRKIRNEAFDIDHNQEVKHYRTFYKIVSILLCLGIIGMLVWTASYLSVFGNAGNPDSNEVPTRYVSRGLQETGAINMVTGMAPDRRASDTPGESCALSIVSYCVMILLRIDKNSDSEARKKRMAETNDCLHEPKNDIILQKVVCVLAPLVLIFGVYIILNGHLSPDGELSGGVVTGSGLILHLNASGFERTPKLSTGKTFRYITLRALSFYRITKSYSFFTGVNHLANDIPLGIPGTILNNGLILPLNICVGLAVVCTICTFYGLFRKGGT